MYTFVLLYVMQKNNVKLLAVNEDSSSSTSFCVDAQSNYQTVVHISDTDLAYYDLILKRASVLLSPVQLNLLKLALSLRAYSSTVYSFQQVNRTSPQLFNVNAK